MSTAAISYPAVPVLEGPRRRLSISASTLRHLFVLLCGVAIVLLSQETSPNRISGIQIAFEDAPTDVIEKGPDLVAETADRFEQVTKRKIGHMPIRVKFVERISMDGVSEKISKHIQGMTYYTEDECSVHISKRRISSWGRVLSHEVVHVFVYETYGRSQNRLLNEGLAEYLAEKAFPSEVRRDLRNAINSVSMASTLNPYVDGYRFISEHATDENFSKFFASEIKNRFTSYELLQRAWDRQR